MLALMHREKQLASTELVRIMHDQYKQLDVRN